MITRYWHARRERAAADEGSEVFISLVDLGFNPDAPGEWTLEAETTCLNRDLPHRLNLGEGTSAFRLTQGGPIEAIKCLTGRATPTLRVPQKRGGLWRIISHLSLNHWSLTDSEDGADALREILALYDFADSADTRSMIEGLLSVAARRVPGRAGGGICRGLELTVRLDEDRFAGHGIYLFAAVLERFLGLYCSLNSFSKLIVTTNRREGESCGDGSPGRGKQCFCRWCGRPACPTCSRDGRTTKPAVAGAGAPLRVLPGGAADAPAGRCSVRRPAAASARR